MARQAVLKAAQAAFHVTPEQVRDALREGPNGRVYGALILSNAPQLEHLNAAERGTAFWNALESISVESAGDVGIINVRSEDEAQEEGL